MEQLITAYDVNHRDLEKAKISILFSAVKPHIYDFPLECSIGLKSKSYALDSRKKIQCIVRLSHI